MPPFWYWPSLCAGATSDAAGGGRGGGVACGGSHPRRPPTVTRNSSAVDLVAPRAGVGPVASHRHCALLVCGRCPGRPQLSLRAHRGHLRGRHRRRQLCAPPARTWRLRRRGRTRTRTLRRAPAARLLLLLLLPCRAALRQRDCHLLRMCHWPQTRRHRRTGTRLCPPCRVPTPSCPMRSRPPTPIR